MTEILLHGDSVEMLECLESESMSLCVTSPPYDDIRTYGQGGSPEWDFAATARQLYRVLAPGGVICWMIGDATKNGSETLSSFRQALYFVDKVGFRMHDTMIYQKKGFTHPEKVRYHQTFEYIFVLSKGAPRVFNPICDRKNLNPGGKSYLGKTNTFTDTKGCKISSGRVGHDQRGVTSEFGMRFNVWIGNTRSQEQVCTATVHPAMMPEWLARDLILSWSDPGDWVIDPFVGSGTTIQQARLVGRDSVGIDVSGDYISEIEESMGIRRESV